MRFHAAGFAFVSTFLAAASAQAFSIDDHEAITRQAVIEYNRCFPANPVTPSAEAAITAANRGEDLNVFRKWATYSHYFHPEKRIDMRRKDSSERILDLVEDLRRHEGDVEEIEHDIGHVLHHIQDMASPPHVVPVNHWLTDGFESFDVQMPSAPAGSNCASVVANATSFEAIFAKAAKATLQNVRQGRLSAKAGARAQLIPLTGYWEESADDRFGEYGVFGNAFGDSRVKASGVSYAVDSKEYRAFKAAQLRLAVDATKSALAVWMKP